MPMKKMPTDAKTTRQTKKAANQMQGKTKKTC